MVLATVVCFCSLNQPDVTGHLQGSEAFPYRMVVLPCRTATLTQTGSVLFHKWTAHNGIGQNFIYIVFLNFSFHSLNLCKQAFMYFVTLECASVCISVYSLCLHLSHWSLYSLSLFNKCVREGEVCNFKCRIWSYYSGDYEHTFFSEVTYEYWSLIWNASIFRRWRQHLHNPPKHWYVPYLSNIWSVWYCRDLVSSCNIYAVQQDIQSF